MTLNNPSPASQVLPFTKGDFQPLYTTENIDNSIFISDRLVWKLKINLKKYQNVYNLYKYSINIFV